MTEVTLKTLVCSTPCDFLYGGSAHHSAFSSSPLSPSRHRTAELHNDSILYLFEEPVKSMAKHLREKVYVQGCRVLDVGSAHHKECLALFLSDSDYAERVDEFGNFKEHLFAKYTPKGTKATRASPHLRCPSKAAADQRRGYYMVLLHMDDKKPKWRMLKSLQKYSLEYPALDGGSGGADGIPSGDMASGSAPARAAGLASNGKVSSFDSAAVKGDGAANSLVRNTFNELLSVGGTAAALAVPKAPQRQRQAEHSTKAAPKPPLTRSDSESSIATVLSDHEVLQLADVLRTYEDKVKSEEPRVGSFAGASGGGTPSPLGTSQSASLAGAVAQGQGEEEELLPETSSPVTAAGGCGGSPLSNDQGNGSPLKSDSSSTGTGDVGMCPARLRSSPLFGPCIEGRPDNQRCADCGEPFPTWCVMRPFGCFVCINCVGVHRRLWSNKCREVEMDKWPPEDIAFMASRGNRVVNEELEACMAYPAGGLLAAMGHVAVKPNGRLTPVAQRATYIQHKYEDQLFTREKHLEATRSVSDHAAGGAAGSNNKVGSTGDPATAAASAASPSSPLSPSPAPLQGPGGAARSVVESLISNIAAVDSSDDGPPQYCGLADILVKELVTRSQSHPGAVCVVTNGFQALRTKAGRKLVNMPTSTAWDEHLQVGVEQMEKPLYCAVYNAKMELLAAAEFHLPRPVVEAGAAAMVAVEMPWCELNKKASARRDGEVWQVTMLTSFRSLA